MSKIGALTFDLQEQVDAAFFAEGTPPAKSPAVQKLEFLVNTCEAYRRQYRLRSRKETPVASLNPFN